MSGALETVEGEPEPVRDNVSISAIKKVKASFRSCFFVLQSRILLRLHHMVREYPHLVMCLVLMLPSLDIDSRMESEYRGLFRMAS
jgi:hypothetical protein